MLGLGYCCGTSFIDLTSGSFRKQPLILSPLYLLVMCAIVKQPATFPPMSLAWHKSLVVQSSVILFKTKQALKM